MKRLLLWRHAKASAGDPRGDDADRELAARGTEGAAAMAAHFQGVLGQSQLILCSPAVRTRQTLAALETLIDDSPTIRFERGLYLASHLELLDRMARVEEEHATLLMIGHNPGIEELVRHLISDGDADSLERFAGGFKAGALAQLELDLAHWREAGAGCGRLTGYHRPRDVEPITENV